MAWPPKHSESTSKTGERLYPEQRFHSTEAYLLYLRHLFAYEFVKAQLSTSQLVVEIGCGEGYGFNNLAQAVKAMIGVDHDQAVLAAASKKYGVPNCTFVQADGARLPFAQSVCDVVLTFQVLEHIQDDRGFLAEIYRILKPGGRCFLTTPNGLFRIQPNHRPWNRFHLREYSPTELEALAQALFTKVQIYGIQGTQEIQALEKARVHRAQRLAALIPSPIRRLLPPTLEAWLATWLRRYRQRGQTASEAFTKYQLQDYAIGQMPNDQSLDLLAILTKT
jgi:ubiquinone/menaquinone biosynthesis C-methylase UbiE